MKVDERKGESVAELVAVYDLEVCPVTYDIVSFICMAKSQAMALRRSSWTMLVVYGPNAGFREGNREHYDRLEWRMRQILLASVFAFAEETELHVFRSRSAAAAFLESRPSVRLFPEGYSVSRPVAYYATGRQVSMARQRGGLPGLSASQDGRNFVRQWLTTRLGKRNPVSITLRQCPYEQSRNSNLAAWLGFARRISEIGYAPFFIVDTDQAMEMLEELKGFEVFTAASFNIELRAAAYEESFLNMMINNGTSSLCYNNPNTRYLYFKVVTETSPSTCLWYFAEYGFWPGSQWPQATPHQRFVWEDDAESVLLLAFEQMAARIDGTAELSAAKYAKMIEAALRDGEVPRAIGVSAVALAMRPDAAELWRLRRDCLVAAKRYREAFYLMQHRSYRSVSVAEDLLYLSGALDEALSRKDGAMLGDCLERAVRCGGEARSEFLESVAPHVPAGVELGRSFEASRTLGDDGELVFGTGQAGLRYRKGKGDDERPVVAWVDNDASKWGREIDGLPVLAPGDVSIEASGQIVVASQYSYDIILQLIGMGIAVERIRVAPLAVTLGHVEAGGPA